MKCYLCEQDAEIRETPDLNRGKFVICEHCGRYILAWESLQFMIDQKRLEAEDLIKLSKWVIDHPPRITLKTIEEVTGKKSEGELIR